MLTDMMTRIPGIPPTGKKLRIPFVAIVNIRGDRLYHEHITWDQASVLKQLDLLPEYLPYPHPLPDGKLVAPGKRLEFKVPATGVDTALKMLNKNAVESNAMFTYGLREVNV
jgi:carboxymethylenebutenolidase